MHTKKISLFYSITGREVIPPKITALEKKEKWMAVVQDSVQSAGKPKIVKVTYEIFNPEVLSQQKFFNGPVVEYFAIQDRDQYEGRVTKEDKDMYRETILDEILGYNIAIKGGTIRRRGSSSDFRDVQEWSDFLNTAKETVFEPNGYEFPDSEEYEKLKGAYGESKSKDIAIELLQKRMRGKTGEN